MAKGHVTDEELETSLKSLGGLSGIAATGARRDSPFGSDYVKTNAAAEKLPPENAPEPQVVKTIELRAVNTAAAPATESRAEPKRAHTAALTPKAKPIEKTAPVETPAPLPSRKSDCFTERVTVQMSPDMR